MNAPAAVRSLFSAVVAIVSLATAPALFAQLPPEIGAGALYFRRTPLELDPATRLATDVDIGVTGIVARVSVSQRFRNDSPDWVEGVYVFPLPDDAAVDRLSMQIGERRIEGEIQERERAKQTYERARERGQHASLVEQERPNLFTTSVANIGPGEEVVIEIAYLQTAAYGRGRFSLRFPMTLTPRYVPGTTLGFAKGEGWSFDTTAVSDASRVTPPMLAPSSNATNPATVKAVIDAGIPLARVESLYHDVATVRDGDRYELTLAAASVPMDRDFVLEWQPTTGSAPRAVAFTETIGSSSYVLAMFLPPENATLAQAQPREMLFVIDTSGSMGGPSIEQAKSALQFALARLNAGDRFNVIEFNSTTRALFAAPVAAEPSALAAASRFVEGLRADGGTEMDPAIGLALAYPETPGYLRQIVFITDGAVGNEAALFARIHRNLGDARFFTIGIGSAPNSHFMRKAAQFGRGSFTQLSRSDEVAPRMQALFEKLEHAALTDITIDWPDAAEVLPERIPDLYFGEPVVVAARLGRRLTPPASALRTDDAAIAGSGGRSTHACYSADDIHLIFEPSRIAVERPLDRQGSSPAR